MSVGASPEIRHSQKKEKGGVNYSRSVCNQTGITLLKLVTDTHLPAYIGYFRNDFNCAHTSIRTS